MIDIGLTKIIVVGAVALIVIGPKELPRVARMAGTLLGRAQRYMRQVKDEVSRQIELDELKKAQEEFQSAQNEFQKDVQDFAQGVQQNLNLPTSGEAAYADDHDVFQHHEQHQALKVKKFRRAKLAKNTGMPTWYKNRQAVRTQVMSGSARMAKYRVRSNPSSRFF